MLSSLLTVAVHDSFSFELVYFEGAYSDVILSRLSLTVRWLGNAFVVQELDLAELNFVIVSRVTEIKLQQSRVQSGS